jgi:Arc/MetJ-type ribon-helix-helix transcriptional regulator
MTVSLTPELQHLIDAEVAAGRFRDVDEFLEAAVQHYVIARDLGETYAREEIEEKIAHGLAQVEHGETIDGDEAFLQLRSQSAERRRRAI